VWFNVANQTLIFNESKNHQKTHEKGKMVELRVQCAVAGVNTSGRRVEWSRAASRNESLGDLAEWNGSICV